MSKRWTNLAVSFTKEDQEKIPDLKSLKNALSDTIVEVTDEIGSKIQDFLDFLELDDQPQECIHISCTDIDPIRNMYPRGHPVREAIYQFDWKKIEYITEKRLLGFLRYYSTSHEKSFQKINQMIEIAEGIDDESFLIILEIANDDINCWDISEKLLGIAEKYWIHINEEYKKLIEKIQRKK